MASVVSDQTAGHSCRSSKNPDRQSVATCADRLKLLNPESLELRRLRSDLSLIYKVLFGIVCIDSDALLTVRNQPHLRGHNYTVVKPRFVSSVRRGFLVQE